MFSIEKPSAFCDYFQTLDTQMQKTQNCPPTQAHRGDVESELDTPQSQVLSGKSLSNEK
jgi:hypothetical protein